MQSHILDLRCIPEALPYFVTPRAVDEDSALLQQLPHWAACSITQALEFLSPAYKGHPRVMAYVLRVLESYPPERVTFFMPQLVQALRYDNGVSYIMKMLVFVLLLYLVHYNESCDPGKSIDSSLFDVMFHLRFAISNYVELLLLYPKIVNTERETHVDR